MNFKLVSLTITLCVFILIRNHAQSSNKINFKNIDYNTFKVKIDKYNMESFFLFENTNQVKHGDFVEEFENFFDSLDIGKSLFITNSSIVNSDCSPLGLYISENKIYRPVNNGNGNGNFYLKPNGAILINDNDAIICETSQINNYLNDKIRIGLQSGPMLVYNNQINKKFGINSNNKFIRSGVGIFTTNSNEKYLIFAISLQPVSFHDFSSFFLNEFNCENALCIESAGSLMNIPLLKNPNDYSQNIICNYLVYKSVPMESSGTGFALSSDGHIVTNYHVIDGASKIVLKGLNGQFDKTYNLEIVKVNIKTDLAILKINDPKFTSIRNIPYTINQNKSEVGSEVFATGYPLRSTMGDEIKLTNGMISANSGFKGDINCYQISAPIQPGNSGGPLFNEKGIIIGITNAVHTGAQNANYAIKSKILFNLMGTMNKTPSLNKTNTISNLNLTDQFKKIKNYVYIIEANR